MRIKYDVFFPPNDLKNIVKHFIVINSYKDLNKLLFIPNGGNFLIFNRGINAKIKSFSGNETKEFPDSYCISAKSIKARMIVVDELKQDESLLPLILVELLPLGYYKLFNENALVLSKQHQNIDKKIIAKYFSKLYTHKDINAELKYLSKALLSMVNPRCKEDLCIGDVLDKIHNEYYDIQVQDLIKEFNCSRSTLERHFKKKIGITPKNYIMTAKFCRTLLEYVQKKKTFSEISYLYSDNSHMNATFKKFLGVTPSEIFKKVKNKEYCIYQINNMKLEKLMNSY